MHIHIHLRTYIYIYIYIGMYILNNIQLLLIGSIRGIIKTDLHCNLPFGHSPVRV